MILTYCFGVIILISLKHPLLTAQLRILSNPFFSNLHVLLQQWALITLQNILTYSKYQFFPALNEFFFVYTYTSIFVGRMLPFPVSMQLRWIWPHLPITHTFLLGPNNLFWPTGAPHTGVLQSHLWPTHSLEHNHLFRIGIWPKSRIFDTSLDKVLSFEFTC